MGARWKVRSAGATSPRSGGGLRSASGPRSARSPRRRRSTPGCAARRPRRAGSTRSSTRGARRSCSRQWRCSRRRRPRRPRRISSACSSSCRGTRRAWGRTSRRTCVSARRPSSVAWPACDLGWQPRRLLRGPPPGPSGLPLPRARPKGSRSGGGRSTRFAAWRMPAGAPRSASRSSGQWRPRSGRASSSWRPWRGSRSWSASQR
mmetsp:Transcript_11269/g.33377  ORF Transcript_11269/g.33377 Transcript_11269/m.33377 type:complete len:205 (-) Transcript_11269:247-861(-)